MVDPKGGGRPSDKSLLIFIPVCTSLPLVTLTSTCIQALIFTLYLQAGRDLRFLSISMSGCFIFGGLLLLVCYFSRAC